eukprot:TRINITY_DN15810_c0_g1_i1.p1 TRINITY_DN15810_c0_g1~~TRINITY_DN15810_c0_g1_i1.p1  ORF type:complete len:373 (-),score=27.28 TRINITY_DN15810_c0_g1_i1:69-1187(-)
MHSENPNYRSPCRVLLHCWSFILHGIFVDILLKHTSLDIVMGSIQRPLKGMPMFLSSLSLFLWLRFSVVSSRDPSLNAKYHVDLRNPNNGNSAGVSSGTPAVADYGTSAGYPSDLPPSSTNAVISRSTELPMGTVFGIQCAEVPAVTQYMGIPFAEAPVGDLRFRAPVMMESLYENGQLNATSMPAPCGSYCVGGAGTGEVFDLSSEDCLYLNMWVPPSAALGLKKLPVRVYVHGGSITSCSASDPEWSRCQAASKIEVIQVNIQFRKGPFGFLAHLATMEESGTTGNWALLDQQMALKWVRKYIPYFGGDPDKILLNGHSSGGQAVDFHMVIPSSDGLFAAALAQSGPCVHFLTLHQRIISIWEDSFPGVC